jgi:hypothetical protein
LCKNGILPVLYNLKAEICHFADTVLINRLIKKKNTIHQTHFDALQRVAPPGFHTWVEKTPADVKQTITHTHTVIKKRIAHNG